MTTPDCFLQERVCMHADHGKELICIINRIGFFAIGIKSKMSN